MSEIDNNIQEQKPKICKIALTSVFFALLGWINYLCVMLPPFRYLKETDLIVVRISLPIWFFSLTLVVIAFVRIKRKHPATRGKTQAKIGICLSLVAIIFTFVLPYLLLVIVNAR